MAKNQSTESPSTSKSQECDSRSGDQTSSENAPLDLASGFRGLYAQVARTLGVNPSCVRRVARGEQQSEDIEEELRRELERTVQKFGKKGASARRKTARKKRIARKRALKTRANAK